LLLQNMKIAPGRTLAQFSYYDFLLLLKDPNAVGSHNDICGIHHIQTGENNAFPTAGIPFGVSKERHQCGNADEDAGVDGNCTAGSHRRDGAGETQDKKNIEKAGAHHIAHSDAGIAFLCGDDRGNQLGKRGTDGNNGKSDEGFAHTQGGGDGLCTVNDQLSAADDGGSAEDDEKNTLGPGKHLLLRCFSAAFQCASDKDEHIERKENEKNDRLSTAEESIYQHNEKSCANCKIDGHISFQNVHIRDNGQDRRGDTHYDQDIKQIRAHSIAQRDFVGSAEACRKADCGLRKRSADGDHGKTDDQRGDLQLSGDGGCAVNENICALDQQHKPNDQ